MSHNLQHVLNQAFSEMGDAVREKLYLTGLNDTPTGYETGKFVRVNSAGDAIEYSDISFLNDIADAPENQLVSGYLQLDKDGKLVWSPATTDGDVSYTITGATHFTGLLDTPTGYEHGQYLRVHPSDKKLEYISVTGLAQDIGDEIVNNIISNDLLAFTGLNDTPENYIDGSYVKSTTDGLIYTNPATLGQDVLANTTGLASGYLRIDDDGTGIVIVDRETFKDEIDLQTDFIGLQDTPSDYNSGYYLRSTENGIEYTEPSELGKDVLTNATGLASGYLRIDDDGTGIVIVDRETFKEEIDLQSDFTGLLDTPSDYNNGAYLRSTANSLEYIETIIPKSYSSINDLPASMDDGSVVSVGEELYIIRNGSWSKVGVANQEIPSSYPACVKTQSEMIEYDKYEKEFSDTLAEQELINTINGIETNIDIKNVCLFNQDIYSDIILDENASWQNRGDVGALYDYKYGRISRAKNQFAFVALKVGGSASQKRISWEYFDVVTLDKNTQTITNSQRIKKEMNSPTYVTHNFQWISMINYIDGADTTNYDDTSNTQVRRIEIYKLNSSTNTYELHDIINKPDGWNDQAWDGNSLKEAKISEDGNQLLVQTYRDPTSGSVAQRLRNFVRNGDSWSQVNTFTLTDDVSLAIKNVNKDFTKIALSAGFTKYIYNINYETSTLENVSTLSFEGNAWNINENFDTLLIGIRNGNRTTDGSFYVYKLNIENNTWRITNNGDPLVLNVSTAGYASISEDGSIVMVPAGNIYYYNSSNDTWSVMIGSVGGGTWGNLFSWDGSTLVRDDGNVYETYFSQTPKINTNIYNNSVYIEESTYKWGMFEQGTTINLNGSIDTNCTFTEWKSSEATFGNNTNLNTTAEITNDASITGVFNCG